MNKKRLLKMADFVETIPRAKFDMGTVWSECGAVGCAMGHAAKARIFRDLRLNENGNTELRGLWFSFDVAAQDLFCIPGSAARSLFNWQPNNGTPKQVARNIRRFVETGKLP